MTSRIGLRQPSEKNPERIEYLKKKIRGYYEEIKKYLVEEWKRVLKKRGYSDKIFDNIIKALERNVPNFSGLK